MLEKITKADFDKCIGQDFKADLGEGTLNLRLEEVAALSEGARLPEGREPFSIILHGPKDQHLEQQIYQLDHSELGKNPDLSRASRPGRPQQ